MTNNDLKQELIIIKKSLYSLETLTRQSGIESIELNPFIKLLMERFVDLDSHLVSALNTYEILETMQSDGKEAALALADSFHSDLSVAANS